MTKLLLALTVIPCIALYSCKSSSTQTNLPPASDTTFVLKNTNFDSGGTHGWNGWTFHHSFDTIDFEQDAPPGGGTWGFKIHSVDFPTQSNNITQSFTNLSSGVYEFTLWSHSKYVYPDSIIHPAWISIAKISGGIGDTLIDSLHFDLNWHPETFLDTLTLLPTDTVTLEVSCGLAIVHGDPTTVDDFTFAKLP
jgi:hypothetical protein